MDYKWNTILSGLPPLDEDNCCLDESDIGRYSKVVLVFDESAADTLRAVYDGKRKIWNNADTGDVLHDVIAWGDLPIFEG